MALAKRRKAPKTRVQQKGALSLEKSKALIVFKTDGKRSAPVKNKNSGPSKQTKIISRRYNICGETGHNARIYSKNAESSNESESDKT